MSEEKSWKIEIPNDSYVDRKDYTINGHKYSRVTRVLGIIAKHGLAAWYRKVGEKRAKQIIETRQVIGTKTHKLFELMLQKKKFDLSTYEEEIQDNVALFKDFKKNTKLVPHAMEQKLWSNKHKYAGTADYIGMYTSYPDYLIRGHEARFPKGALVVGDWKTSKAIYKDYWLQLAAYVWAFYELTGIKVEGAFIAQFRFGKLKIDEKSWDELIEIFEAFKAANIVFRWVYNIKDD